jgi:hypothetical protein
MENPNQSEQMTDNEQFIAYCGLYCKACQVRPCCVENGFFTCADCTIYASTKDCKKYNPLLLKIASWVESSDRSKAIEMIKTKGRPEFAAFMEDKNWVCFKTKDSIFNKRFGKKVNEK